MSLRDPGLTRLLLAELARRRANVTQLQVQGAPLTPAQQWQLAAECLEAFAATMPQNELEQQTARFRSWDVGLAIDAVLQGMAHAAAAADQHWRTP